LEHLVTQISLAQTPEEVKQYLMEALDESLQLTEEAQAKLAAQKSAADDG
jgi:hypothetical protein